MEEQKPLDKKKRCPKGQTRNKEGNCVENVKKPNRRLNETQPKETQPNETQPKETQPKSKTVKSKKVKILKDINRKGSPLPKNVKSKTMKKLSKVQAAKLLAERRNCIQSFRDKL